MKTRKRKHIVALAVAALAALLMLSACPGIAGGGGDPPPGSSADYLIRVDPAPLDGKVTIDPETSRAAAGADVTVTLVPNSNYEPDNFAVFRDGYSTSVPFTATATPYTYTFKMPDYPVRIRVQFITLVQAIEKAGESISIHSSWEDIAALNAMIVKAQRITPTDTALVIPRTIEKLVGKARPPTIPQGEGEDPLFEKDKLGLIRTKMRLEDLMPWMPLNYPSYPMDKGIDFIDLNKPASGVSLRPLGDDRTHLYYVEEDNPTLPDPVLPPGWTATRPFPTEEPPAGPHLYDVRKISLTYQVGLKITDVVGYQMWLVPVAQYTIVYEAGAAGSVTIQDYWPLDTARQAPPGTTVPYVNTGGGTASNSYYARNPQTLNASNNKKTGDVGKKHTKSGTTDVLEREVFTRIETSQQGVQVSVLTSGGNPVPNVLDTTTTPGSESIQAIAGVNISISIPTGQSYVAGAFYPESRNYTIRVRPTTPPSGF